MGAEAAAAEVVVVEVAFVVTVRCESELILVAGDMSPGDATPSGESRAAGCENVGDEVGDDEEEEESWLSPGSQLNKKLQSIQ